MLKRTTALAVAVIVLFTFALPAEAARISYSDVKTSDWYYGSLGAMSDNNIISGYPDGSFRGSDTLQVDQFVAMLCRLTDNDVGLGDSHWSDNYIAFASESGWLDGLNITNYSKPINRFETARLTTKSLGLTLETYPATYAEYDIYVGDYTKVPYKFKDDVLVNYALGITRGYPDGTFQGYNTLTRAEGAVISHRIFDETVRKPPLVPEVAAELMMLFPIMPPPMLPMLDEVLMPGPMMLFPMPGLAEPVALAETPLDPNIAVISENVLASSILELVDGESTNALGAGYNYGVFNINLLTEDNDSLLIFTTEVGNSVITIDLLQMTDADGNIPKDAVDLIRLICQNINYEQSEEMLAWILDNYKNRAAIPVEGNNITLDDTLMGISSLVHDHNVLKVTIATGL